MKLGKKTIAILFFCLIGLSFSNVVSAACSYHCNDDPNKAAADFCYGIGGSVGGFGDCTGQNTCGMYSIPVCCCNTGNFTVNNGQITNNAPLPGNTPAKAAPKFKIPEIAIKIPGMAQFSEAQCTGTPPVCTVNWIGEYIGGVYQYAVGIAGIAAVIVLMIGGIIWLVSGGDASKITQSKELILGSVSGLILLLCSYMILYEINPDLTKFKSLSLGYINEIVLEGDNSSPGVTLDVAKIAQVFGAKCGADTVSEIVKKAKGKVTYSQELRGQSAPGNFVYLDCSSFSSFVFKCATGRNTGGRSADIFKDQQVWDQKLESLEPGDMVGWAPQNNKNNSGHVIIYMGDGLFGDCHGGSGKQPGNCVSSSMSFETVKKYAASHSDGKLYTKRY